MRKRTIIAIIVAFILTIGMSAFWSVQSDKRNGDTDANTIEDNGSRAGESTEKKSGNKLGKIFGHRFAPLVTCFITRTTNFSG